ncbi:rhodanese-like domain-containing protein [Hymenobacter persicinus]|uniref:Rhodanese-like domain-containing protein n=1 Tax=Hymenobacter persicinus TaxID=2025506 RepID=A0A4Q5LAS1_9BACT|nr:rhodanese-like domain-containing protein [Hymenobacter persicinus]RYU78249.1 rhodanese-like domain-containing protein [Hymenobacter persicinus]
MTKKIGFWRAAKSVLGILPALVGLVTLPACSKERPAQQPAGPSAAYAQLLRTLYRETVPLIQPAELAALRRQSEAVVLLDTRTPAEYKVSHLRGARFVNFDHYEQATFADLPRDQPIVVYCSVGYRSERVGERLRALGFTHVRNLYGGIFEWVNEGHAVVNAQGPTQNVHPYSALWSAWLQRGNKVYE